MPTKHALSTPIIPAPVLILGGHGTIVEYNEPFEACSVSPRSLLHFGPDAQRQYRLEATERLVALVF